MKDHILESEQLFPAELGSTDLIWDRIEQRQKGKVRKLNVFHYGIAASLLIGMVLTLQLFKQSPEQQEHAMTVMLFEQEITAVSNEEFEALEFIKQWCVANAIACKTDEFQMIGMELTGTQEALNSLVQDMAVFGEDPALNKAKSRILQHRSDVIKQIMKQL
ncbi:MAG: hypothetical protein JXQ90_17600 [Cyclobacteriaceae bacterium]